MPTMEEMNEWREKWKKEREEFNKEIEEIRRKEWEKKGIKPVDIGKIPPERCDHPNTIEDSTATVLWIIVMLLVQYSKVTGLFGLLRLLFGLGLLQDIKNK